MIMGIRQLAIRMMSDGYEFPKITEIEEDKIEEVDIRKL